MGIIERILDTIDMDKIVAEVIKDIKIGQLELFFVVDKYPGNDDYELVGVAYSISSAREILENKYNHLYEGKIFRFDLGKLVTIVAEMGAAEEVV